MRAQRPRDRRIIGLAVVVVACAYLAYPYVSLYRLGAAMQRGDMQFVMSAIDWDSVRSGIAEEVASRMTGSDENEAAPDDLPAFGTSFATSVATKAVNTELTPRAFAASLSQGPAPAGAGRSDLNGARLTWAFFSSPTSFVAELCTPGGAPVKLRLDLVGTNWMLTRAWLPPEMLGQMHHT